MAENLVIVESPAKAKTISRFLGKDFIIKSSYGHIRDLSKKNYGIDIKNGYAPEYEIDPEKKKIVSELRKFVKKAKYIWLASDEDREGEAIAWHLAEVLKLSKEKTKRIVFHEITKQAINNAIASPREIDQNLVNAQQARRILDRLVGFELSEVLWKKVKSSLSAGRVQSVSVRLIVEREREIIAFNSQSSYKVVGVFLIPDKNGKISKLKAEYPKKLKTKKEAQEFLNQCVDSEFEIINIEKKPSKKSPTPPFTTSTLQQEASRKLGFSVSQTMRIAQKLYEEGKITYMRTDSVNLSKEAIHSNKEYIIKNYGEKYSNPRQYKTKAKGAQEAHEAIRPTTIDLVVSANGNEQRLYELIFKRTLASQMSDALLEKTNVAIQITNNKEKLIATGEVIKFDGFIRVYKESTDDENENKEKSLIPPISLHQKLNLEQLQATERFTHHPPRYTEASLVKKLEELGIGRPSTYAPIISTVQKRGYVIKEDREGKQRKYNEITLKNNSVKAQLKTEKTGQERNKLFPTDIAMVVTDFLMENFNKVMDYNFTATVEKDFDEIAEGKVVWNKMIDEFYKSFHKTVKITIEEKERKTGERELGIDPDSGRKVIARIGRFGPIVQLGNNEDDKKPVYASLKKTQHLENITLKDALELLNNDSNGRELGTDPKTGKKIFARVGRYGPMVQLGENSEDEKPKFASLLKGQNVNTITLTEALELFKLPRDLGKFEEKKVTVGVGRFGPYINHNSKFVSLKKTDDPLKIEMERAIELILEKREADAKRLIKEFDNDKDMKIIKDRWGKPCVYYKKKYYRIAKDVDAESLSYEDCLKIADVKLDKTTKAKKTTTKKTTAKKSTAKKKTASAKKSSTKKK